MDFKKLSIFLTKAHLNGYASAGEEREKVLPDGSKEFKYKENEFFARDRYLGSGFFIGEEIVFKKDKAIWGMNYYGGVISKNIPKKQIYGFLKQALTKVKEDKPFRGPANFKKDDFKYINKAEGTVEKFMGMETIFHKERLVYKLNYHGGLIV